MLSFALIAAALVPQLAPLDARPTARPDTTARDTATLATLPVRADAGDAGARALLGRARAARLAQDAALTSYDAHTYQRFSVGLGLGAFARERLLLRTEGAAHVTWARGAGVTVEQTGSRAVFPLANEQHTTADLVDATPIPYFPGRETLWFPSSSFGVAKPDVDPTSFIHPLANGSEAYYRYALGESSGIRLPDGRSIGLRELKITPRRPSPRAFVGSFWFDTASGHVVRAVYRMSVDFDLWAAADADVRRRLDSLRQAAAHDTATAGAADRRRARAGAEQDIREEHPPRWFTFATGPVRATISAITVEYGLFQGRVWLPRRSVAEGQATSGFLRMPVTLDERYRYDAVTVAGEGAPARAVSSGTPGRDSVPNSAVPNSATRAAAPAVLRTAIDSALALAPADSAARGEVMVGTSGGREARAGLRGTTGAERRARVDSLLRAWARAGVDLTRRSDSLTALGDSAGARRLTGERDRLRRRAAGLARRESQCGSGATFYDAGASHRGDDGPVVRVRRPCDRSTLATSPDLPKSPYDADETPTGAADRAALLSALDGVVPAAWPPHAPRLRTGLDLVRFNRVEGLSVGVGATTTLPAGYAADATLRLGLADFVPNAELGVTRTRGASNPSTLRLAAYHRLAVANDDWGNPLGFGASLAAALYGRDEGFYYRSWGAELRGTRPADALVDPDATPSTGWNPLDLFRGAALGWRVFAEDERGAAAELRKGAIGPRYVPNVAADRLAAFGVGGDLARTFGADPAGLRATVRARVEGAAARYADDGPGPRTAPYARALGEVTLSRPLGFVTPSVTAATGALAGGRVPVQRLFYLGGLQTVRGNFPRAEGDGYIGRQFWLTRAELGLGTGTLVRPVVFFDAGRAGERAFARGETLRGAGAGATFLDGLLRAEVAKGLGAQKAVRVDLSLGGRF
ncbi:hypothetical protein tb265_18570 [Gemmatimonadetes bacterium T265]|nr:hypothetical protein tb265_18570 [Gemmatimonadetes bacterium T265]